MSLTGGKDDFAIGREAAEHLLQAFPGFRIAAKSNQMWMHCAARPGTSPSRASPSSSTSAPASRRAPNLHEVVQEIVPKARVVYADNDPIVLAHSRAPLVSRPQGMTAYLEADVTAPQSIVESNEVKELLDLNQPVALSLVLRRPRTGRHRRVHRVMCSL